MSDSLSEAEADTCRKMVVPKLVAVGCDSDPRSIAEQRSITDGRIIPAGKGFVRKAPKRVLGDVDRGAERGEIRRERPAQIVDRPRLDLVSRGELGKASGRASGKCGRQLLAH